MTIFGIKERIKEGIRMRKIDKIIIHCSDSLFGDVEEIRKWHTDKKPKGRGWKDIGYHFVILNGIRKYDSRYNLGDDGVVETGRPTEVMGAHVSGHNKHSIGICLVGKEHFSAKQLLSALPELVGSLMDKHNLKRGAVYGHRAFSSKTCPNFDVGLLYIGDSR